MDWMIWGCSLVGWGVSFGGGWWLGRSTCRTAVADCEPDLAEKLKQTELAYRMATEMSQFKGGFLARTSHELRSPLSGLIGMQQLILSDLCDSPAEEREFIAQSNESALKMVAVLDNLIEVAKLEHGNSKLEIQPVQLSLLLQDVYTLTHLQAQNCNLRLQVYPPDSDLYGLADPLRLRQVLVNLVDRSLQQMEQGSLIISVQPSSEWVQIWLDNTEEECWSEAIDLIQSPPAADRFPAPGLTLWVNYTLLQLMQGKLELVAPPFSQPALVKPLKTKIATRLQCSIPRLVLEVE